MLRSNASQKIAQPQRQIRSVGTRPDIHVCDLSGGGADVLVALARACRLFAEWIGCMDASRHSAIIGGH
jgi:hypothetical protein